jgi:flagellar basal-body rod protein FlgG
MSTFQGLIRRSIINTETQYERLSQITNNVANYNTTAYKAVRLSKFLTKTAYLSGVARTNFTPGSFMKTQNPLDISIMGSGFIPLTSKTGMLVYTREGSFKLNKDGYIVTSDDYLEGDGINIPANYSSLRIKPDGDVAITYVNGEPEKVLGKIPLVNFINNEGLKQLDNNKYSPTADSGEPVLLKNHNYIAQGGLERQIINVYNEVNDVLRLNATMLASFKLMKAIDECITKL